MKKLLITTLAAVSVGFCAKAETAVFSENGVSFEESGVPAAGESFFGIKQVDGQDVYDVDVASGWATDASTDDLFTVTNVSGVTYPSRPQMWDGKANTKALAIDTTVPLVRNADGSTGEAQTLSDPIFFDSVVQFTATDVATAPAAEDKLLVWLYASEGVDADNPGIFGETEAITNLVITAGYYDGQDGLTGNLMTTNYLTGVYIEPATWHRLTIKADNNIGVNTPGFEVYIDNKLVSGKCDYKSETPTMVTKFPSLVEKDISGNNVVTGVAFDGKGAVDDIVFTTTAPEFAKEPEEPTVETYTLSIVGENFEYEVYTDEAWSDKVTDLTAINTEYKTLWLGITPTGNYELESIKLGDKTITLPEYDEVEKLYYLDELQISTEDIDNGATFTLTITMKEKAGGGSGEDPAKPTIGGNAVDTAVAFIAAANSGVTIKVPTDWTLDGNTLKYANGNVYATFADYYTVTLATDGTVTLKLNDNAKPTIGETAADKGDAIVVTDAAVALGVTNAKAGLWYGAQAYSDAACTTKIGDEPTGWEKATGETVTVTATKPEGDKAFFKVVVDDQDHSSEEQN